MLELYCSRYVYPKFELCEEKQKGWVKTAKKKIHVHACVCVCE